MGINVQRENMMTCESYHQYPTVGATSNPPKKEVWSTTRRGGARGRWLIIHAAIVLATQKFPFDRDRTVSYMNEVGFTLNGEMK